MGSFSLEKDPGILVYVAEIPGFSQVGLGKSYCIICRPFIPSIICILSGNIPAIILGMDVIGNGRLVFDLDKKNMFIST